MKKKLWMIMAMAAMVGLLFVTCNDDDNNGEDTRKTLTAGSAVSAAAGETSANVTFSGAEGLTLTGADFKVVFDASVNVSISSTVTVNEGVATVVVTFPANTAAVKQYVIGINPNSKKIKGEATVNINHAAGGAAPNAQKLAAVEDGLSGYKAWTFNSSKAEPNKPATFKDSKFLVIKSINGGKSDGFLADGFESIEWEVAGAGSDWGDLSNNGNWARMKAKPIADGDGWYVPFTHTATETIYLIYDLSKFWTALDDAVKLSNENAIFEFRFFWGPAEGVLGTYEAFLTAVNLGIGSGDAELKYDNNGAPAGGSWELDHGTVFGWITRNPVGLVLP